MSSLNVEEHIPAEVSLKISAINNRSRWQYVVLIIAAIYMVVSLYLILDTRSRLASLSAADNAAIQKLQQHQTATDKEVKATSNELVQQLNATESQLRAGYTSTTAQLRQHQQAFETRLQQQNERLGHVTGDVASVQSELGGAKKEIADTRTDLESTKVKLDRAIGDLTGQSSLIARTREDLEELRHRSDRNYYEFTLYKGARPTLVSTVNLQLKKANPNKSKFTLNVGSDDRVIEKKDRGVAEPLQFYSGRDRLLYEIVIFTVEKNKVTGYLSTPKSAGPATVQD